MPRKTHTDKRDAKKGRGKSASMEKRTPRPKPKIDFTVDADQGLAGFCDFILSRSPEQQFLRSPVAAIVEAKNENLKTGLGPCIAAMIGARLFNEREGQPVARVYGAVTSGSVWRFLQLEGPVVSLDQL